MIKVLSTTPPYTVCQSCKRGSLPISDEITFEYFQGKEIKCPECGNILNWWDQILMQILWRFPNFSLAPAGALDTWLLVLMKPGKITTIKLADFGIPENARLLQIGYSPQGKGLFPVELHGNIPIRHIIPHTIQLYGRPFGEPAPETNVVVRILWIPNSENEDSWHNLTIAFEAFHNGLYDSTIIPANVAVESKLYRILSAALVSVASSDRVDNFLESAATYSHQLNVLLPLITSKLALPILPDYIRGSLNKLRKSRNAMAHKGKLDIPTTEREAAEYICTSFFTFVYLKQVEQRL
jgi:hypothetical protein